MGKIKHIVYLIEYPFNRRDYDRYGFELLKANGFDIEVWDFTPFLKPQVNNKDIVPDPINFDRHSQFNSMKEACTALKSLHSGTMIICLITLNVSSNPLFRAMTESCLPYCILIGSRYPLRTRGRKEFHFKEKLLELSPGKVGNKIYNSIPLRYLKLQSASFALVTGGMGTLGSNRMIGPGTEVIHAHSFDYDIFLNHKDNNAAEVKNLAVFLDEYLPFHPDYKYHGMKRFSTAEAYYAPLCNYFSYLESECNLEVVIAAHPRSQYDNPDYFAGRHVMTGRTAELVKQSKLVLLHSSTAVNYAVLFKKPLVFLTSDSLNTSGLREYIFRMASLFGKKPININREADYRCEHLFDLDDSLYATYKNKFIKTEGSKEGLSWQIFADHIKGFNKAEA
jgi:hypothetical protein